MSDPQSAAASRAPIAGVAILFCLSGMTGLIYEVIWSRHLQHLFGASTLAITIVVAAYMTGLALGSGLFGRLADRLDARAAIGAYGLLELVIGGFAFLFIPLVEVVAWVYRGLATQIVDSLGIRVACDFGLSFALLLIPTTLMGGTLPLITRTLVARAGGTGRGFGWAYALNTAGAVLGTFLAGFYLVETWGLRRSLWVFGVVNLAIGSAALALGGRRWRELAAVWRKRDAAAPEQPKAPTATGGHRALMVLAAVTGCVSLGSEIVWIRGFSSLFLSTTQTFSLVLMVFLAGITLGSAIGTRLRPSPGLLTGMLLLLGVCALTQVALYAPFHRHLFGELMGGASYDDFRLRQALLIGLTVFPLTLCSGAILPLVVALSARGADRVGRDVGRVYIANTIGSVLGAVLAGFVLLPHLGAVTGSRSLAILALAAAVLAGSRLGQPPPRQALAWLTGAAVLVVGVVLLPGPNVRLQVWSPAYIFNKVPTDVPAEHRARVLNLDAKNAHVTEFAHGISADIAICVDADVSQQSLFINGMPNASAHGDKFTQLGLAVFPYLYAPRVDDCLHIGLGSGITAGAWAALPGTGPTRVVELEGRLWDVTRRFAGHHFGLHDNPKVEFIVDDAAAQLDLTPDRSLDVIVSEPSQLWSKGVGNLFTSEFFATAGRKLRRDGLLIAWVMGYRVSGDMWAVALATLLDEFAHVHAFEHPGRRGDVLFLCSQQPLELRRDRWRTFRDAAGPGGAIQWLMQLSRPSDLAVFSLADDTTLRQAVASQLRRAGLDGIRNTLDLPLLEFRYPRWTIDPVDNTLLDALRQGRGQRWSAGEPPAPTPPGVTWDRPPLAVRYAVHRHQGTMQLEHVAGLERFAATAGGVPRFDALLAAVDDLTEEQRHWAYACAVAQRAVPAAGALWPRVRGDLRRVAFLGVCAVEHATGIEDPGFIADVVAALPPPAPDTPHAVLEFQLEAMLRDRQGAGPFVTAFLRSSPAARFIGELVQRKFLRNLVFAAAQTGRLPQVEAYLRRIDTVFAGQQYCVGLALCDTLARLDRRDDARQVLARYVGYRLVDPYLTALREQFAGR